MQNGGRVYAGFEASSIREKPHYSRPGVMLSTPADHRGLYVVQDRERGGQGAQRNEVATMLCSQCSRLKWLMLYHIAPDTKYKQAAGGRLGVRATGT